MPFSSRPDGPGLACRLVTDDETLVGRRIRAIHLDPIKPLTGAFPISCVTAQRLVPVQFQGSAHETDGFQLELEGITGTGGVFIFLDAVEILRLRTLLDELENNHGLLLADMRRRTVKTTPET
jgi:hypothetical protein